MENNNDEKIDIMFKKISEARRTHLEGQMRSAVEKILKSKAKSNATYSVEITERFDKEEPHQFVWISLKIMMSDKPLPFMVATPQGMMQPMSTAIKVVDMEVYEPSDIDHWLDHVERIKKQENLYLEKEGKVEKGSLNSNDETAERIESAMNQELTDEQNIIEQQWMFMPLFTSLSPKKKTKEEYISTFYKHMRLFANRIMDTHIHRDNENSIGAYNYIHSGFVMLMSEFDMCDFTEFSKEQLEMFGFINWRNKMMMIPMWAFPCVLKNNDGLKVTDIQGQTFVVGKSFIDTENKNGSMAVGFPFKMEGGEVKFTFDYEKPENSEQKT